MLLREGRSRDCTQELVCLRGQGAHGGKDKRSKSPTLLVAHCAILARFLIAWTKETSIMVVCVRSVGDGAILAVMSKSTSPRCDDFSAGADFLWSVMGSLDP